MYVGCIACCPLVSHIEYVPCALLRLEKMMGQTDGRTDGRTVALCFLLDSASVINGDGECGQKQFTGRLTARVSWLALRAGSHLVMSLHSSNELHEQLQWLWNDEITTNICSVLFCF